MKWLSRLLNFLRRNSAVMLAGMEMKIEPWVSPTISFGTKRQYLDSLHKCGKTHREAKSRKTVVRKGVRGK